MNVVEAVPPVTGDASRLRARAIPAAICVAAITILVTYRWELASGVLDLQVNSEWAAHRAWSVLLAIVFLYAIANLFSSRKYPVLYLRRFGMPANVIVRRAIKGGLGRTFRFIALDDSRFPQVGMPWIERVLGIAGIPFLTLLILVGGFLLIGQLLPAEIGVDIAKDLIHVLRYWLAVLWTVAMMAYAHLWRVRRRSRIRVRRPAHVARLAYCARACGTWWLRASFLAPQITIARVADAVWRPAVCAVAAQSAVTLVDVSEPTANLQWEIEYLHEAGCACVFIGEHERLSAWLAAPNAAAAGVRDLVGNDAVLSYRAGSRAQGRLFRRNLGHALARAVTEKEHPQYTSLGFGFWFREFAKSYAYYGCSFLLAVCAGAVVSGVWW